MARSIVLCLALVMLFMPAAWSGQISPDLMEKLNGLSASDQVEVLVMFENQADISTLNHQLKVEKSTLAERNRQVIEALQATAGQTQPVMSVYFDQLVSEGLILDYRMYWIANMAMVTSTSAGVYEMASRNDIADLYINYEVVGEQPVKEEDSGPPVIASHEVGLDRINAPAAWQAGFTGAGRVVMNIDTGVDGNHPALRDRFRGDVDEDGDVDESWFDPYDTHYPTPVDDNSHGTHTMGTICGRTPAGDTIGVAIDAKWIAAGAIDRGGGIPRTVADAIASFQWAVDPDGDPNTQDNPDAIGNSWGVTTGHGYPPCDQTFWTVIDNVEAAGSAVIFSAGNEGPSPNSLRRPADRGTTPYNCFSVGAVDGNNPSLPIASFSSRGPSNCGPNGEQVIKPEVVAPGVSVRSSIPGGGYAYYDGTSMASPHITGSVAVMRSANPDLDVETIKEILMATAVDLPFSNPDGEENTYGHGIIDLYEACLVAQTGYGFVEGHVYDEDNNPIGGATISVLNSTRLAYADEDGFYHLGLPADTTYDLVATYFGHLPDSGQATIIADETVTLDFSLAFAPFGALEGHVTDLDMNPLEGAIVRVADTPLDPVYTDDEGYYIMDNIPGGSYYDIEATAAGYGLGRANLFIPINDTVEQDFALQELESFEASDGGWVGEGVWEWGEPSSGPGQAYDGNNVWGTVLGGQYPNNADDDLYTTYFTITDPGATFTFYHWYDMESTYDGGNVQASLDGGMNWELLTPESGYPDPDVLGLDGEPGYSSQNGDWELAVFDLSAYEGETIKLKLRFGSDGSITYDGWYIDGVVLNGGINWGTLEPAMSVTPGFFSAHLNQGQVVSHDLTVSNAGPGLLEFTAAAISDDRLLAGIPTQPVEDPNAADASFVEKSHVGGLTYYNYVGPKSSTQAPAAGGDVITDQGGPDAYGYRWLDSDEPNGPVYNWIDISSNGEYISGLGDDTNVGPFGIGFEFPFYGNVFTSFRFCTNGWLSFTSTVTDFSNDPLPTNGYEPFNLVAPFWDDLNFNDGGEAYYYTNDEDSLIVSYINVPHYSYGGPGPYTFQVIMLASGDIVYQYADVNDPVNSNTIGIQNEDGSIGLQVVYEDNYAEAGKAVMFKHPTFWLTVSPSSGVLFPEESATLQATFDASEIDEGTYTGNIFINSNDPDNPSVAVPCTLVVGPTGIEDETGSLPTVFGLNQNFPNPFNPKTEISFGLPQKGQTRLEVYDMLGRRVKTLVNGELEAGVHKVIWDSRNDSGEPVASGIYFYKLAQGEQLITKKMVMLK